MARITVDGKLRWINTQRYPVLTGGAPVTGVEVIVESVEGVQACRLCQS